MVRLASRSKFWPRPGPLQLDVEHLASAWPRHPVNLALKMCYPMRNIRRSVTAARIWGLTTNCILSHHHWIQLMRFTGWMTIWVHSRRKENLDRIPLLIWNMHNYTGSQKIRANFIFFMITSANVDQFSYFFSPLNSERICGGITATSSQICCHTTLWNVSGQLRSFTEQLI